jgi:23S rRNA (adenine2503-C2)-methyltransferase
MKEFLVGKSLSELEKIIENLNEKKFRAKQIFDWIYKKNASDFDEMSNLSKDFREKLKSKFYLRSMEIAEESDIGDSVKYLWKLYDGQYVESVLMLSEKRNTVCISSQVGCAVDCKFCATGRMGFKRNLNAGEIIEQILNIRDRLNDERVTNIVFMGMGEPMLNYDEVVRAAELFADENAFGISTRKITISTSGILPAIYRYADEKQPYRFAISLNEVDQKRREISMPISKKWPISDLLKVAKYYTKQTGNRITFEYVMVKDQNISEKDAKDLMKMTNNLNCKVNLIPCNTDLPEYPRPNDLEIESFLKILEPATSPILLRRTRGRKIDAACGMLHNKFIEKK